VGGQPGNRLSYPDGGIQLQCDELIVGIGRSTRLNKEV